MKTLNKILLTLASILALISCEKDGEKIYLQSLGSDELIATTDKVVLSVETSQKVVLSFAWKGQDVHINDTTVGTAAKAKNYMEISLSEDFSGQIYKDETTSNSIAYKGGELNSIVNGLGAKVGEVNNVFFRLGSATGENIPYAYSNVVKVAVTPYVLDMRIGKIIQSSSNNTDLTDTGYFLYSPEDNGIYSGFMFTEWNWYNYFLKEADETTWGTDNNVAFTINSNTGKNMWFPEHKGCYYVNVNTVEKRWDALYISSLNVNGLTDSPIEFTLDNDNKLWIANFEASEAGEKTITITGSGQQYNVETGISSSNETNVNFATDENNNLVLADNAGNISVTIPQAGECTIKLDLINPNNRKVYIEAGGTDIPEEPEEIPQIYLPGLNQNQGEGWNWNSILTLMYPESDMKYSGVLQVNATDGHYDIYTNSDWNADKYILDENDNTSTAFEGNLVKGGSKHIPAPTNGLYLFDIDLKNRTYKLTTIDKLYIYLGENNGSLHEMSPTGTIGEFSITETIPTGDNWGIKFYLFENWTGCFGNGGNGILYYAGNNDTTGIEVQAGSKYTITANIINKTYSIEPINE